MPITSFDITIPAGRVILPGTLTVPSLARGVVAFVHGSGSSRFSPRNTLVSQALHKVHVASLLFDLLTEEEDANPRARFDIKLLTERLLAATSWLVEQASVKQLPLGYFGASTGAAAALAAAAKMGTGVTAVVSRGGRPDLAGELNLGKVVAPTLLIVGGNDDVVIELNQLALEKMHCEKQLIIVPGATHLFEEPGALDQVAQLAADWFSRYFS